MISCAAILVFFFLQKLTTTVTFHGRSLLSSCTSLSVSSEEKICSLISDMLLGRMYPSIFHLPILWPLLYIHVLVSSHFHRASNSILHNLFRRDSDLCNVTFLHWPRRIDWNTQTLTCFFPCAFAIWRWRKPVLFCWSHLVSLFAYFSGTIGFLLCTGLKKKIYNISSSFHLKLGSANFGCIARPSWGLPGIRQEMLHVMNSRWYITWIIIITDSFCEGLMKNRGQIQLFWLLITEEEL